MIWNCSFVAKFHIWILLIKPKHFTPTSYINNAFHFNPSNSSGVRIGARVFHFFKAKNL